MLSEAPALFMTSDSAKRQYSVRGPSVCSSMFP